MSCVMIERAKSTRENLVDCSTTKDYELDALDYVIKQAERYEKLRKINATEFSHLYFKNICGYGSFDKLVDELEEKK